jgi:DNA-binding transcriptional LysR family regulator
MAQNRSLVAALDNHSPTFTNWDDLRLFLILARTGSVRQATVDASLSRPAIMRRLDTLEARLGRPLFYRSNSGLALTTDGERVLRYAEEMQKQAQALADTMLVKQKGLRERVRISITEGLGTFWVVPRALEFMEKERAIGLDIHCDMQPPVMDELEIDCAVMLDPPNDPDLLVTRLGWLHVGLFASRGYIERYGAPQSFNDLNKHPFVHLVAAQIPFAQLEDGDWEDSRAFVNLTVNTSSAQVLAVCTNAGIAALPSYAVALSDELVHIVPEFSIRRDVWLVVHPRMAERLPVRKTIDWLRKAFDPDRFPWFAEHYVLPKDLPSLKDVEPGFSRFPLADWPKHAANAATSITVVSSDRSSVTKPQTSKTDA